MLSRTANNLYWLGRYVERAESTARLLGMGRRMTMLPNGAHNDEWQSVIQASGVDIDPAAGQVQEIDAVRMLLLSRDNPSSICSCVSLARNSGRAIRTALTQEMWESLNDGWRELENTDVNRAIRDLSGILDWVKRRAAIFRGASDSGMLRNDGFDFLRVGGYVERADMMLRLLDVKYYVLLPETDVVGGGRDSYQWSSVLYATSAVRAYHHLYTGDYSPWKVSDFLILNRSFPRSLAFSYSRISDHLSSLAKRYGDEHSCHHTCEAIVARLVTLEMGEIFKSGLHEFLQTGLSDTAKLSEQIAQAYHFQ